MANSYYSSIKVDKDIENPLDTVSCMASNSYHREGYAVLVGSWDGFVRYYEIEGMHASKVLARKWEYFLHHPVLACDINPDMLAIVGLGNGDVVLVDIRNDKNMILLGAHEAPICRVFWCQEYGMVLSLGYDMNIKCFNFQNVNGSFERQAFKLPVKTYAADLSFPYLIIASSEGKIALISLKQLNKVEIPSQYHSIELSLISKIRCIAIHAAGKRFSVGTVDGNFVSTEFSDSYNGVKIDKPFTTKLQKKSDYGKNSMIGQINTVSIGMKDNKYPFLLFGGSEQSAIFDPIKNRKLKNLTTQATVTAGIISYDGQYVFYATGSDWMKGLDELSEVRKTKLYAVKITTSDVSGSGGFR